MIIGEWKGEDKLFFVWEMGVKFVVNFNIVSCVY